MVESFTIRRVLILAVILIFGFGAAVAVPSLVRAHSRTVRLEGLIPNAVDEPGVFVEPNAIQATNGYTTFYVAKTGDGTDPTLGWSTAYTQVQQALSAALSGDEIWVAAGVYTPGETISDSFNLVPGAALYGGFDTGDVLFIDRDWQTNMTVLSGDIDGNDATDGNGMVTDTDNITGTNSLHVVFADGTGSIIMTDSTKLDGFTITAGNADGLAPVDNSGGGFYCKGSGVTKQCSPSLSNMVFSGNLAGKGGAMFNQALSSGLSSPVLSAVNFSGNTANNSGGAIFNNGVSGGESSPILTNVTFSKNSAGNGGAIRNFGSINGIASPSLTQVSFISNAAEFTGGGIYNEGSYNGTSSPTMLQVTFTGNTAGVWGGAMYNLGFNNSGESSPKLTDVLFSGNFSDQFGGALYNKSDTNGISSPVLINVTISGNWADGAGGAMLNEGIRGGTSAPSVINSILWNNRDVKSNAGINYTGINNITATVILTHSLLQGSGGSGDWITDTNLINGGGNIDQDPMFMTPVSPSDAPTIVGNLRLASGSAAVDKGDNNLSAQLPVDLDGYQRTQDGDGDSVATVDMGAYESPTAYKLIVDQAGTGSGVVASAPAWINCGSVCEVLLPEGTQLTLRATADPGFKFDGWSGACNIKLDCPITMDGEKNLTANFSPSQHNLSVTLAGDGNGKVTSQPAGIDCGSDCNQDYDYNQQVTLTAAADPGSNFAGWGGTCSGAGTCEVTMTQARQVSAAFSIDYGYSVYLPVEFR